MKKPEEKKPSESNGVSEHVRTRSSTLPLYLVKPTGARRLREQELARVHTVQANFSASPGGIALRDIKPRSLAFEQEIAPTRRGSFRAGVHPNTDACSLDRSQVKLHARELQKKLWRLSADLEVDKQKRKKLAIDPFFGAKVLGYEVVMSSHRIQGSRSIRKQGIVAAFDRNRQSIWVSSMQSASEIRFGVAHELGHILMHRELSAHRDRVGSFFNRCRPPNELEADQFAAEFLLPSRLVVEEFELRFASLSKLSPSDLRFYLQVKPGGVEMSEREISRALASSPGIDQREMGSLASAFEVSVTAMAIRLEELGLVPYGSRVDR